MTRTRTGVRMSNPAAASQSPRGFEGRVPCILTEVGLSIKMNFTIDQLGRLTLMANGTKIGVVYRASNPQRTMHDLTLQSLQSPNPAVSRSFAQDALDAGRE